MSPWSISSAIGVLATVGLFGFILDKLVLFRQLFPFPSSQFIAVGILILSL